MIITSLLRPPRSRSAPWPALRPALVWAGVGIVLLAIFGLVVRAAPTFLDRSVTAPDAPRILYGLGELESNGQETFRWSGARWSVVLFGFARATPAVLSIQATPARPPAAPPAILQVGDSAPLSARFAVAPGWRTYHVLTRPAEAGERQIIAVSSTTFVPDETHDQRRLGIAVKRIRVEQLPAAAGSAPPVVPRALFLALATLMGAAALRRRGLPLPLVATAALGLVALLSALQLRAAPTLGYWLPSAWYLLGGGAGALLIAPASAWLQRRAGAPAWWLWALAGGIALSLVGTLALWMRQPVWVGLSIAAGGTAITLAAITHALVPAVMPEAARPASRGSWIALLGITAVALALRLYRINDLPIALWRDEVYHGLNALEIWRNPAYRPIYVPDVDLPALLFYLIAPIVGTFGQDIWTLRIVPALAGTLTPLALWFALRPMFGNRAALIAAWCMAVAAWGLYMSRWAFPVIFDPLFSLVAIGCVWRGLAPGIGRRRAVGWLATGGLFTGLAVYTYHTGRLAPAVVALFAIVRLRQGHLWRDRRLALAIGGLAFALTLAPLVAYAIANPAAFSKRVSYVSIFNSPAAEPTPPLTMLQDNLVRYALMWHVRSDHNARHYAPDRPMLDPIGGALLLLGAGICLLASRSAPRAALLLWLAIGLVPGILSDEAPHAMRSIGAFAPACALTALGLDALLRALATAPRRRRAALTGALLAALAAWNVLLYFGTTSDQRVMFRQFETTRTLLARAARAVATAPAPGDARYQAYLWDDLLAGRPGLVTQFLLDDAPVGRFDGTKLAPPAGSHALLLLPGDMNPALRAAAVHALGPQARLLRTGPPIPDSGEPIYLIYGIGPEAQRLAGQLPLP